MRRSPAVGPLEYLGTLANPLRLPNSISAREFVGQQLDRAAQREGWGKKLLAFLSSPER
jgi:hypothetical protein